MKKLNLLLIGGSFVPFIFLFAALFLSACTSNAPGKDEAVVKAETTTTPPATVTNPKISLAPTEYADLAEKSLQHMAKFEFDAWADMLADDVIYAFPDGDVTTRTRLEGKKAVLDWWKTWRQTSGVESMTMTDFNHIPINATAQLNGGAPMGIYDIAYCSNKIVFSGKPVALRMNFSIHFNNDKKIDRYMTYYDRNVIVKATGKNVLEDAKAKK
jgi:hypothetical protein